MSFRPSHLIFILLVAIGFGPSAGAEDFTFEEALDIPAQETVIELNSVEGAVRYEAEIKSYAQIWASPYKFNVQNSDFKIKVRLSPGRYAIRTISIDEEGTRGPWSEWADFEVVYVSPSAIYPAEGSTLEPLSDQNQKIRFEWPEVAGVSGYEFQLLTEHGEVLKTKVTVQPWTVEELVSGAKYKWTFKPQGLEGQNENSSTEVHQFQIATSDPAGREVIIEGETSATALRYQFEIVRLASEDQKSASAIYELEHSQFQGRLAPGKYEVRIRTYFQDRSVSDWSSPSPFMVAQEPLKPLMPEEGLTLAAQDENTPVTFQWTPHPEAQSYTLLVYDNSDRLIQKVATTQTQVVVSVPHARAYRWTVKPSLLGQPEPQADSLQALDPRWAFSVGEFAKIKLAAAEEPSELYSWLRYYTSIIRYRGENYDLNSEIEQLFNGGTAEGAVGYWHRGSNFGLMANVGVTGLWLPKGFYNYTNGGVHFGSRFQRESGAIFRIWLGVSYVEFPEFLESPYTGAWNFKRAKNMGPQIQLSYMDEFRRNPKFGYHLYSVAYQGTKDLASPNGLPQVPRISYTIGVFGTYRRTENTKWQLGYAYRKESLEYKSTDRLGINNSSTTDGHYLSLSLEWGLGKKTTNP